MTKLEILDPTTFEWKLVAAIKDGQKMTRKGDVLTVDWVTDDNQKVKTNYNLNKFVAYSIL